MDRTGRGSKDENEIINSDKSVNTNEGVKKGMVSDVSFSVFFSFLFFRCTGLQ